MNTSTIHKHAMMVSLPLSLTTLKGHHHSVMLIQEMSLYNGKWIVHKMIDLAQLKKLIVYLICYWLGFFEKHRHRRQLLYLLNWSNITWNSLKMSILLWMILKLHLPVIVGLIQKLNHLSVSASLLSTRWSICSWLVLGPCCTKKICESLNRIY